MNFTDTALRYAKVGWPVLPIFSIKDGHCACWKGAECTETAKHPIISGGLTNATTDETVIRLWGNLYGTANLAVRTDNLVVVDVDSVKVPEAKAAMSALVAEHPELRDAWIVRTGSGGYHYIFAANPDKPIGNSTSKLGKGIDTRGIGGYIVVPPSVHKSGGHYKWLRKTDELPMVPDWMFDLLSKAKETEGTFTGGGEPIPPHTRHAFFLQLAARLRNLNADEETMYAMMMKENEKRCDPLHDVEDIRKIAEDFAKKNSYDYIGQDIMKFAMQTLTEPTPDATDKTVFTPYTKIHKQDIDWIFPGYIATKKFGLMWGMEGNGKSYTTTGISADISNGKPMPGERLPMGVKPGQVLLIAYEDDPEDTIKERLERCGADMSNIYTVLAKDGSFTYKEFKKIKVAINEMDNLRILFLDPILMYCPGINDNSESEVRGAMTEILQLAAERNFAVVGVKHANKNEDKSWANRISGSRGWSALARTTFLVGHDNTMIQGPDQTYGGMMRTKSNFGMALPLKFQVLDGVFSWAGTDLSMTPERLFPEKEEKKK
jgi:hypothetical protein